MILVDTSIWIDHFRSGDRRLVTFLGEGVVGCHPLVIGELACGHLRRRDEVIDLLKALPAVIEATHDEVLHFIDMHGLAGAGLGLVDVHLLAAVAMSGDALWTRDRRLQAIASRLGLSAD